ncbi:hypothetical protein DL764_009092 [Monosporascus ibericus]|uniref:Uncharacterized protein n=1 Tax=Monosporascus ibericus TaxID=155417 RepID=A0A4Q4SY23_9PEZI|nr:hypothetical protein DL764_009092 [Monosporascus ibericus]
MDSVDLRDFAAPPLTALGRALWYAAAAPCSLLYFLARSSLNAVFVTLNLLLGLLCGLMFMIVVLSIYQAVEEKRKAEAEREAKAKDKYSQAKEKYSQAKEKYKPNEKEEEKEEEKTEKTEGSGMVKGEKGVSGNGDHYWKGHKDPNGRRSGISNGSARGRKSGKERQAMEMTMERLVKETKSASQTGGRARTQAAIAAAAAADNTAAAAGNNTAAAGPYSSCFLSFSSRRDSPTPFVPPSPTSQPAAPQQQPPADRYDWYADLALMTDYTYNSSPRERRSF